MVMLPTSGRPKLDSAAGIRMAERKGVNLRKTRYLIGGMRGYFPKSLGPTPGNDRDVDDDGFFLLVVDDAGAVAFWRTYNGNTDPSGWKVGRAALEPGVWPCYQFDTHRGAKRQYPAICQRRGPVTVKRDGQGLQTGMFGINLHEHGDWGTSSLGCQTFPNSQWEGFYADAKREAIKLWGDRWDDETLTYVLFDMAEEARLDAAAPVTVPDPSPAPVEPSAAAVGAGIAGIDIGAIFDPPASPPPPAPAARKSIADFIGGFIDAHEGGLSMEPADNGNWTGGRRGEGKLVGSKFGVTPGAAADFRGVPVASITAADIAALTRDEAIRIGVANYYEAPGLNLLPWNRVTLSIIDKGWGSGPRQAIKLLQRMVGADDDGKIKAGGETVRKYTAWLAQHGEEAAARIWADVRIAFDTSLNQPRFINGWNNRTRSFLPGTTWWGEWA